MDEILPVLSSETSPMALQRNEEFKESLVAFLKNLRLETQKVYKQAVFEFMQYVLTRFPLDTARDLKRSHIILYKENLEKSGQANRTILKKMSAISSFCKFLAHDGLVDKDIVFGIKRPSSRNKRETADLSDKDVRKLFDGMRQDKVYYMHHRALLAVGFYTGLRSKEIRHLKIGDYGKADGHTVIRCIIKGDKAHEVPLNPFVVKCLDEHIEKLKELGFKLDSGDYLFPSIKSKLNKPIQASALVTIFRNRLSEAGIESSTLRRYSPHSMRATLAGHLLNTVEAPLEQVQQTLGHASPTTTMKYNKREKSHDKSPVYRIEY